MKKIFFHIKAKSALFMIVSAIFLGGLTAYGYVMPADQILDFMIKNFSGFRTVTVIQSTLQTQAWSEKVFTEQLWLESPDKYSIKALDSLSGRDFFAPDILYRQLFLANSREKIERILLPLGIDLSITSYTRFEGEIAFRIGKGEPDSPKLIIEKKRFLPLMIMYKVPDNPESELITVRFDDYQKEGKGWYPYEITYNQGENLVEKYTIQTIQTNIPIDASILNIFPEYELPEVPEPEPMTPIDGLQDDFPDELKRELKEDSMNPDSENDSANPDLANPDIDKDRLRNVIKAFEEEYQ